jgi:hypothetical protein
MFSGEDDKITLEYVGQFILQCGEARANDMFEGLREATRGGVSRSQIKFFYKNRCNTPFC